MASGVRAHRFHPLRSATRPDAHILPLRIGRSHTRPPIRESNNKSSLKPSNLLFRIRDLSRAQVQFVRFCLVGASGFAVNLAVYAAMLSLGLHYLAAAAVSFVVAALSNFLWNRRWTFEARTAGWFGQCSRALLVSGLSLGLNQVFLLALVAADAGRLEAQAAAILLVTPLSFAANKVWAFGGRVAVPQT
jgi:putative flippase GtrA